MKKLLTLFAFLFCANLPAQILSKQNQAETINDILDNRLEVLLPKLMDEKGIDMWVIISREYNEDPVLKTMLPATWLSARRRTILIFYKANHQNQIEKLAVARYDVGQTIKSAWDISKVPDQWDAVVAIIKSRNPNQIGLNYSDNFALADGITKTDYETFTKKLPPEFRTKVVSAEKLAIAWIETRTPKELKLYETLSMITHNIIKEAFSTKVIKPGFTTTDDVVWWLRQKVSDLGLQTWFHPDIDIQRSEIDKSSLKDSINQSIIQPGDLLHCDFGISYLRLNTDCQEHAYVLKPNETEIPYFLVKAFETGNKLQDIFTNNFIQGKTGNEILLKSLAEAKKAGLNPSIYTHPLGYFGHSAGPTIGMWDHQNGVPVNGDYPLNYNTAYAIELNNTVDLPEWQTKIRIMLEQDAVFTETGIHYIDGRQTQLIKIRNPEN